MKRFLRELRQLLALLGDINNELQMIRKATDDWATETRLLRELIANATAAPGKDHEFSDSFPCVDVFVKAGYTHPSQLPRTASGLKKIAGLDDTAVYEVLRAISEITMLRQGVKS